MTVKLDKTPPTISAGRSPAANSFGWNNTDVTVSFVCGDELSGIASCTPPQTVTGEGANQSVVGTAVDEAGNSATDPATVSIDKASPTIGAVPDRAPNRNGWYNADVTVSFTCGDALSGIPAGGCPAAQLLREGANQSATGSALDAAGNTASHGLTGINIDKTAPALSGAASTSPNGNGWYNGEVSVAWVCGDNLSGIDGGICPASSPVTGEGDNLSASASIADRAGNRTSTTVSGLKIDRTAPSITGGVVNADGTPRSANAAGWFNSGIRVAFTCDDALSGVANCASDVVLRGR